MMQRILFEPVDSLFFRDGRPYNMDEPVSDQVGASFPPGSRTLVGAVRAALARAMGWTGGTWNEVIRQQLGNGDDLGPLHFQGPFLIHKGSPLFAPPAHLAGKLGESVTALEPGTECRRSDLGASALFPTRTAKCPEAKPLYSQGCWLTAEGLHKMLDGDVPGPDSLVTQNELWCTEPRVGIQREPSTHTAREGHLYTSSHVRLRRYVALTMDVAHLPRDEKVVGRLEAGFHPLGGEARMCRMTIKDDAVTQSLPAMPLLVGTQDRVCYTVTLLQPAAVERPPRPQERNYAGLPGTVVSACLPKPIVMGGWNSVTRQPLPLRPHLAAGSVLFLEADQAQIDRITQLHGSSIGDNTSWGLGLMIIGRWPGNSGKEGT